MRNQIDKIIITAMDRFVWFILLIVISHLVTEFTRVKGYARGPRHDIVMLNETMLQPKTVQGLLFMPGQDYGLYEASANGYHGNNNNNNPLQTNGNIILPPANSDATNSLFNFSFRPLIDSIFEIPISTLRAVNTLVARLTNSYQLLPGAQKSSVVIDASGTGLHQQTAKTSKFKSALREEIA